MPPNAADWKTQFEAITAAAQASATAMATAFTTAAATALENVAGIKLAFTDINTAAGTAATDSAHCISDRRNRRSGSSPTNSGIISRR